MIKSFDQLSFEAQIYIQDRFAQYGLDGRSMYNNSDIFSNEVKDLSEDDIIKFFEKKDISHIYPKSQFPELEDEPSNVFLEDYKINRARRADIVTQDEIETAMMDQIEDTVDLDIDEDGKVDLDGFQDDFGSDFDWESWDLDLLDLF